jgi:hypothetical protein
LRSHAHLQHSIGFKDKPAGLHDPRKDAVASLPLARDTPVRSQGVVEFVELRDSLPDENAAVHDRVASPDRSAPQPSLD